MRVRPLPLSPSVSPPPLAERDDAALLRALSLDDEAAFAILYDRYWDALHTHAGRKLGCPHEAEEIVQDLFVALWHKRHSADIQQLKPYLFAALK